ncbi:MAG: hypothetical protein KDD25_03670, partial [Bdellovibrionales bacterium]|nr:hypothetical protein [Bdellovibrionales bacterium]
LRALSSADLLLGSLASVTDFDSTKGEFTVNAGGSIFKSKMIIDATGLGYEKNVSAYISNKSEYQLLLANGKLEKSSNLQAQILNSSHPYRRFIGKDVIVVGGGNSADNIVEWLTRSIDGLYYGDDFPSLGYPRKIYWFNPRFPRGLTPENCQEYSANTRVRYCAIASAIKKGLVELVKDPKIRSIKYVNGRVVANEIESDYLISAIGYENNSDQSNQFGVIGKKTPVTLSIDGALDRSGFDLNGYNGRIASGVPDENGLRFYTFDQSGKLDGIIFGRKFLFTNEGIEIVEAIRRNLNIGVFNGKDFDLNFIRLIDSNTVAIRFNVRINQNDIQSYTQVVELSKLPSIKEQFERAKNVYEKREYLVDGEVVGNVLLSSFGKQVPYIYVGAGAKINVSPAELNGVPDNTVALFIRGPKTYLGVQQAIDDFLINSGQTESKHTGQSVNETPNFASGDSKTFDQYVNEASLGGLRFIYLKSKFKFAQLATATQIEDEVKSSFIKFLEEVSKDQELLASLPKETNEQPYLSFEIIAEQFENADSSNGFTIRFAIDPRANLQRLVKALERSGAIEAIDAYVERIERDNFADEDNDEVGNIIRFTIFAYPTIDIKRSDRQFVRISSYPARETRVEIGDRVEREKIPVIEY